MTKRKEVYKCELCGNIVEVVHGGVGELVCCNKPMKLLNENTVDASLEKHVPIIEKTKAGYIVKVGTIPHPMEEKHYIEWVQIITDKKSYRHYFNPGEEPTATFEVEGEIKKVREYCNLHLLWSNS